MQTPDPKYTKLVKHKKITPIFLFHPLCKKYKKINLISQVTFYPFYFNNSSYSELDLIFGSEFVKKAVIRTRICIDGPEGKISAVFTHKKLSNSHKKLIFSHNKSVYLFFYQKELKFRSAIIYSDSVIRPRVQLRFRLYEV